MGSMKLRRSFESGHRRKFLLIVDDSAEVESALYFAASRIEHSGGVIVMCYVIKPQGFQHWMGVRQVQLEEESNTARALFRLFRRKLNLAGFEGVETEEVIREGTTADEVLKLIEEDEDIALLVLGASLDSKGPGPLVASLAAGSRAGTFPVPVTIVPGNLTLELIRSLA
ncbi:MAG TPA: universal stress protein [Hyphomicrobiaceae bacterium]|nr:universal stress protein [Hyphomicrobiaceae bacterium]